MFDKNVLEVFLKNQGKLFPEPVAANEEEAREFLEEVCAAVVESPLEVREYLDDGMDISGMSDEDLMACEEVFPVGDGRFLIVEG